MKLAEDIRDKIETDFNLAEDREIINALLEGIDAPDPARIGRCILHLANGNIARFCQLETLALQDYRDIIVAAEYDQHSYERVRDFSLPFT